MSRRAKCGKRAATTWPSIDIIGEDDQELTHTTDMDALTAHLEALPERQQRILMLKFYGNLTQDQIGDRLGISQMHVSRLMTRALAYLHDRLLSDAEGG